MGDILQLFLALVVEMTHRGKLTVSLGSLFCIFQMCTLIHVPSEFEFCLTSICPTGIRLVGGLEHEFHFSIGNFIITTDFPIVQRGWSTTKQ